VKRRRRRDRNVPPEEQRDWLRVVLETHPEQPPDVKRRLGIVQDEWQD